MAVTITAAQRDALYECIFVWLSGIEDIWVAASQGDFETADRLGREYSDALRLVGDDLGWGPEGPAMELRTDPAVLRRVLLRLRELAEGERELQAGSWAESRALEERNRLVGETCAALLVVLGEAS